MTSPQRNEIQREAKDYGIQVTSYHEGSEKGIEFWGVKTTSYGEAQRLLKMAQRHYAALGENRAASRIASMFSLK